MVTLLRKESEVPNISNTADVRMIRYAYGYNGIAKSVGHELQSEFIASSNTFKLKSGLIVLDGWEVVIDDAGWDFALSLTTGTQAYAVYLEINALTQIAEIKQVFNPSTIFPDIDLGVDLTTNPTGIARLLLYNILVVNGIPSIITKVAQIIPRTNEVFESDRTTIKKASLANIANLLSCKIGGETDLPSNTQRVVYKLADSGLYLVTMTARKKNNGGFYTGDKYKWGSLFFIDDLTTHIVRLDSTANAVISGGIEYFSSTQNLEIEIRATSPIQPDIESYSIYRIASL